MQEAMAQNFAIDEYIKCLDYAHIRGVKGISYFKYFG